MHEHEKKFKKELIERNKREFLFDKITKWTDPSALTNYLDRGFMDKAFRNHLQGDHQTNVSGFELAR